MSPKTSRARTGRGWLEFAGCRGVDPELFFPTADTGNELHGEQVAAAKAVCTACSVRAECLAFALEVLSDGIAGGLDESERRVLRRACRDGTAANTGADTAGTAEGNGVARGELNWSGPAALAREGRAAGRSVPSLAAELGVSTRTVERWTRTGAA